ELSEPRKFSFFVLWPHSRPWKFTHPEPALRSIDNAKEVALILSEAAKTEVNAPKISKTSDAIVVAE
ncbi:MAG: PH domain-containing protein, partial [Paracoccaceae bacterium]